MLSQKITNGFLCLVLSLPLVFFLYRAESKLYFGIQTKEKLKDWRDGPVQYIITEEERKLFKKLHTEEKKAQFIEWFWARRDPEPETIRNEFFEEFNHRINYTNINFKERGFEGWETARGIIYITFGPPTQELRKIYVGGGKKPAILWYYDLPYSLYLNGIEPLVFADTRRKGRYNLISIPEGFEYAYDEIKEMAIRNPTMSLEDFLSKRATADDTASLEIPFQWKFDVIASSKDKITLKITITLLYKDIPYYQEASEYKATLFLSVKLFKEAEQIVDEFQGEINIELTEDELMAKANENLTYRGSIVVDPGDYNIEIILRDIKSGISKTIRHKITAIEEYQ